MPSVETPRYLAFGYNRWKQKPLMIGTPGGYIQIAREPHGTVRVEIVPDGARMVDHTGTVETPSGRTLEPYVIRLVHEEKERDGE